MPKGEKKARYPQLAEAARKMIEDEKIAQHVVAERLGVNRTTIQRWAKRFGWKTQRSGPRSGAGHPEWKGGRRKVGRYWYVYLPEHPRATKQRYVAEHRLLVEAKIGRFLEPNEVVHHIDGNSLNNDPDNLMLFVSNSEHLAHDLKGKQPDWTEEGKRRMLKGIRKSAANRRKRQESGDDPQPRRKPHSPS